MVEAKGKKENRKRKRKWKREDILLEVKVEIIIVADSRDSVADAEIFWENTGIVPKSSISERPEIIIKNQEYYTKNHGEILFKKYFIVLKLKIPEPASYRLRWNFHKFIKSSEKVFK